MPGPAADAITDLALRARSGDAEASEQFIRSTQADVWRACRLLGTRGATDDLTQETYLRAFASLQNYEARSSARTWLLAIARNVCADAVRLAIRERGNPADRPEPFIDPDHSVHLRLILDRLEPGRREAFVLTQVLGYSYTEAAQITGCPVGTIRSRIARARDDLQSAVADRPHERRFGAKRPEPQ